MLDNNGWWITDSNRLYAHYRYQTGKLKGDNTKLKPLFLCPCCKLVWEKILGAKVGREKNIEYYDALPIIGKKRKECPKCK